MLAEPGRDPRAVTPMVSEAQYTDPGYLLFAGEGALLGQRFDWKSGRLTGAPFSIADHVRFFASNGSAGFATSLAGTVAYQAQDDVHRLVWFDRTGKELGTVGAPGKYLTLAIGPDGRRLLFGRAQPKSGVWDVWLFDLERGVETRITSGPESKFGAVWLPDGKSILYSTIERGQPHIVRRQLSTRERGRSRSGRRLPGCTGCLPRRPRARIHRAAPRLVRCLHCAARGEQAAGRPPAREPRDGGSIHPRSLLPGRPLPRVRARTSRASSKPT